MDRIPAHLWMTVGGKSAGDFCGRPRDRSSAGARIPASSLGIAGATQKAGTAPSHCRSDDAGYLLREYQHALPAAEPSVFFARADDGFRGLSSCVASGGVISRLDIVAATTAAVYTAQWAIRHIACESCVTAQSEDDYLRKSFDYRWARLIAHSVPAGEKVLVLESVAAFYAERETLICYEGALNDQLCDMLSVAWDRFQRRVARVGLSFSRTRVEGDSRGADGKSVHARRTMEHLPSTPVSRSRRGAARGRLAPQRLSDPWDVPYAFDNSPVTRWRSWETAAPNMYVTVRFQPAEVRRRPGPHQTSADNSDLKLRLEEVDSQRNVEDA